MNQAVKENYLRKPRILIAPLNWGLGHATRCIPIIRELLRQNVQVLVAGDGQSHALLQNEFPDLVFLPLRGYKIRYGSSGWGLTWEIISGIPNILRSIRTENKWLKNAVKEYSLDGVIADNRYGLYHDQIPSIFLTHQLMIKSPFGRSSEKILQRWNYRWLNHFKECWIPDTESNDNLAGDLSHPEKMPNTRVRYINPLTRFEKKPVAETKDNLIVILSGPEPQRRILEDKIINELKNYHGQVTIVRGLPTSSSIIPSFGQIIFYNHLPADELNKAVQSAEFVISRSGYSTIMDMVELKKKTILIPTPGQTEQEYLASHLLKNRIAFCVTQKKFSFDNALTHAREFDYRFPDIQDNDFLQNAVREFVLSIQHR
jgi:uncharacterized protein (TIGR00661 family)